MIARRKRRGVPPLFAPAGAPSCRIGTARVAAPEVTRALVAAGADVLSLAETRRSLEDVYLELVADDVEAQR